MSPLKTTSLEPGSVLLVSGGAKGITAQCVLEIARHTPCSFILAGRSPVLNPEPEWSAGKAEADLQASALNSFKAQGQKTSPKELQQAVNQVLSSREITATLRKIEKLGALAVYINADVTDVISLKAALGTAVEQFGPVTGIIHGAGNLADKLIENKSGRDFDLVVNTKIIGLQNILQAVQPQALKFIVLFSSVAGFFGNSGQADYAIANEVLNKSAYILQKALPGCRVTAINWGPWDSGMVSDELKKVFEQRGIRLIDSASGVAALHDELTRPDSLPQVVIGSPILSDLDGALPPVPTLTLRRRMTLRDNPFLNDHRIGPQAVLPATCAAAWLADACQALHPGMAFIHMEDFKILKGITFDDSFDEYTLELKPVSASGEDRKIYGALITSPNGGNRRIFHYSGQVTLSRQVPPAPCPASLTALERNNFQPKDGKEYYSNGTLFHGPCFQGIQEVVLLDEKQVVIKVMLPSLSPQIQGQFPARITNPFINDAIVQSLLLWTQAYCDAPCLPSRLHQWEHYRPIPFGVPVWAFLEIVQHNQHAVVGNISVQDENGAEYFRFTGLEGTVSQHLKRFIGKKA